MEVVSKEKLPAIIQDVIDGTFRVFDVKTMANYDADFSSDEPCILNIWSEQQGHGFGYIVFHDFLRRVGAEKTFLATDMTNDGARLVQKAEQDGIIQKVSEPFGLLRLTRWKVIGDPIKNLEKIRDQK